MSAFDPKRTSTEPLRSLDLSLWGDHEAAGISQSCWCRNNGLAASRFARSSLSACGAWVPSLAFPKTSGGETMVGEIRAGVDQFGWSQGRNIRIDYHYAAVSPRLCNGMEKAHCNELICEVGKTGTRTGRHDGEYRRPGADACEAVRCRQQRAAARGRNRRRQVSPDPPGRTCRRACLRDRARILGHHREAARPGAHDDDAARPGTRVGAAPAWIGSVVRGERADQVRGVRRPPGLARLPQVLRIYSEREESRLAHDRAAPL